MKKRKNEEIKKDIKTKKSALATLKKLNGKTIDKDMSKAEQETLLIALAQLAGVADDTNTIRVQ